MTTFAAWIWPRFFPMSAYLKVRYFACMIMKAVSTVRYCGRVVPCCSATTLLSCTSAGSSSSHQKLSPVQLEKTLPVHSPAPGWPFTSASLFRDPSLVVAGVRTTINRDKVNPAWEWRLTPRPVTATFEAGMSTFQNVVPHSMSSKFCALQVSYTYRLLNPITLPYYWCPPLFNKFNEAPFWRDVLASSRNSGAGPPVASQGGALSTGELGRGVAFGWCYNASPWWRLCMGLVSHLHKTVWCGGRADRGCARRRSVSRAASNWPPTSLWRKATFSGDSRPPSASAAHLPGYRWRVRLRTPRLRLWLQRWVLWNVWRGVSIVVGRILRVRALPRAGVRGRGCITLSPLYTVSPD